MKLLLLPLNLKVGCAVLSAPGDGPDLGRAHWQVERGAVRAPRPTSARDIGHKE
jgi:hypothetical protein